MLKFLMLVLKHDNSVVVAICAVVDVVTGSIPVCYCFLFVVIFETTAALSLIGSWVRFPFLVVFVLVFRPRPWRLGVVFSFELVTLEVMLLSRVSSPKGIWGGVDVAARASGCRTAIEKRRWAIRQSPPTIRFG